MPESNFSDKLYTSTEVAQILGVSLRSIYRYLDENKIQAAVKTATGRHRFTKQNINDFLHPSVQKTIQPVQPVQTAVASDIHPKFEEPRDEIEVREKVAAKEKEIEMEVEKEVVKDEVVEEVKEETVDWLARFRQAAEKYKTQVTTTPEIKTPQSATQVWEEPKVEKVEEHIEESEYTYYRSGVGGLKEIAQSLDKSAKNASLDYAFTMQAGLSLHKPIKPFSLIHAYIRPGDKSYFEKVLQLIPSTKDTAQLCLVTSGEAKLYRGRNEMHGLQVVSDQQLKLDLLNEGETDLANELE